MIFKENMDYSLAIEEFEKAAELLPQNDKLIAELAQLYQDNDQLIEATEAYIKLGKLKSSPYILENLLAYKENALAFFNLGDYYYNAGMMEKAVEAFNKSTQFPEDKKSIAMAYYQLALIDLKGEEYAEAIKDKILSQETYPLRIKDFTFDHFANAFIEIGNMHYQGGNLQKAAKNYELAIQLADSNPILSVAHYKLGLTYYRSEDYENALREGEVALSLNPDFLSDQERLIDLLIANSWSIITQQDN
jgi:tetratricopeptide (TPR) repeat protein